MLPRTNVRSRLWDLDGIILQSVQSKLAANQRDVKNSTAYTSASRRSGRRRVSSLSRTEDGGP